MRILHAIHDYLPAHRAGSEIYAHSLCRALSARHHVEVLCAEYDPSRPHGSTTARSVDGIPVTEIVNNWAFPSFAESYRPSGFTGPLRDVLRRVRPDVLHVHSLLNLSFDLPELACREGIPVVATLHDFTLVCPSGGQRVHLAERHVCHEIDTARCARCFGESHFSRQMAAAPTDRSPWRLMRHLLGNRDRPRFGAKEMEARLAQVRDLARHVDLFVSPSRSLAQEMARFGIPASKLRVSDNGFEPLRAVPRQPWSGVLRIGFVGTLAWHKGAHVLLEAVRRLPPGGWRARVHGNLEWFPEYVDTLRELARGLPVELAGGFGPGEAAEVYAGLDVLVVPSLWPENSPLVIHEAFQAGVPVVAARSGGIPELVTHGVNGLVYTPESTSELAEALAGLIQDPTRLERFAAALPAVKSIETDAADWEERYREVRAVPAAR